MIPLISSPGKINIKPPKKIGKYIYREKKNKQDHIMGTK